MGKQYKCIKEKSLLKSKSYSYILKLSLFVFCLKRKKLLYTPCASIRNLTHHSQPTLAILPSCSVVEHLQGLKNTNPKWNLSGREEKKVFCFAFFKNSEQPIHLVVICLYSLYSMFPAKKRPRDYLFFMFPVPPAYPSSFSFLCYHHLISIVPAERAFQDFLIL